MTLKAPIRILADENMPMIDRMCEGLGEVVLRPGRHITPADLVDIDALLVRSVTRVDEALLRDSPVRFVGTATIGTDHLDLEYLNRVGISHGSAPGCNAEAVVDYVLSAVFLLAEQQGFDPCRLTWGVVGVGNVGGRLASRLQAMGCHVLLNDPLRAKNESGFTCLESVLSDADIVCLHTPLTRQGDAPTYHLFNESRLKQLRPDAVLLNAGRGPVIDNVALLNVAQQRPDLQLIMDVWEHEPQVSLPLAEHCKLISPHIAGYSLDGKIRGSYMVYQALAKCIGATEQQSLQTFLPATAAGAVAVEHLSPAQVMRQVYDPGVDDSLLRATLTSCATQAEAFDRLRREYRVRREFSSLQVQAGQQSSLYQAMGFKLAEPTDLP
ncbi:4-phosphoerythronate dehydrogenase PdxB [Pontibacter sp. JAM-7]|uniref:4-phosphoerythronate dehydrogenase PdxB n=1 Tax=Pontibacter sp. JAM-7 TaxID=3366581 RepID=UPI003AF77A91